VSLPSGTVTFLFTDIEGSTRLMQELGDRYVQAQGGSSRDRLRALEAAGGVAYWQGDMSAAKTL
jgi:class 3 adenylate cyclase